MVAVLGFCIRAEGVTEPRAKLSQEHRVCNERTTKRNRRSVNEKRERESGFGVDKSKSKAVGVCVVGRNGWSLESGELRLGI